MDDGLKKFKTIGTRPAAIVGTDKIMTLDPVEFTADLIRCPSVTPSEGGAVDLLQRTLEGMGFTYRKLPFSDVDTPDVDNLYARYGTAANFCFAGHTDVVPTSLSAIGPSILPRRN